MAEISSVTGAMLLKSAEIGRGHAAETTDNGAVGRGLIEHGAHLREDRSPGDVADFCDPEIATPSGARRGVCMPLYSLISLRSRRAARAFVHRLSFARGCTPGPRRRCRAARKALRPPETRPVPSGAKDIVPDPCIRLLMGAHATLCLTADTTTRRISPDTPHCGARAPEPFLQLSTPSYLLWPPAPACHRLREAKTHRHMPWHPSTFTLSAFNLNVGWMEMGCRWHAPTTGIILLTFIGTQDLELVCVPHSASQEGSTQGNLARALLCHQ
ncbi:hypothetical protein JSE7799_02594 [Jannaschia seosinensis]|uniref:Uncharacterized protein n=1 Tax=Jannaschia seosinensis TaxID=313367 RepID=A0A0M7BEW9_9RHOB|nr:hypothetical protein JSE7799_02594 [Jannaschia seosinensis]